MSDKVEHFRERIMQIYDDKKALKLEEEFLLRELQEICKHESVVETKHVPPGMVASADPPRRICAICSLEEEGWGSGYKKLTAEPIRVVDRDEFWGFRNLKPLTTVKIPA